MINNLRVVALVATIILLGMAVVGTDTVARSTAGVVALSLIPFVLFRSFWRRDPDIMMSVLIGVLIGYAVRIPILEADIIENFARTVRINFDVPPITTQRLVADRLLVAVVTVMIVLGFRAYRSGPPSETRDFQDPRYASAPILAAAALWTALSLVSANRFGATAPVVALVRAVIPSTVILTAAIVARFAATRRPSQTARRQLDLTIALLVIAGIAQGRQSVLVLPLVLWLPMAVRKYSAKKMRPVHLVRAAVIGALLIVAGGWAVSAAEDTLKGRTLDTEFSVGRALTQISERTATFDREMSVAAVSRGEPTSSSIDPATVTRTVVARLVPGVDLGGNSSMGRAFAVELQRRSDTQRQEGAWGWIGGAVEIAGTTLWPAVIALHILAAGLLLDYFGRRRDGLVLQIAAGNMLLLQWLPSGNLDRIWSTALRELVLGAIFLKLAWRPEGSAEPTAPSTEPQRTALAETG